MSDFNYFQAHVEITSKTSQDFFEFLWYVSKFYSKNITTAVVIFM